MTDAIPTRDTAPAAPSLSDAATRELDRLEQARTGRGEASLQVDTQGLEGSVSARLGEHWTVTGFVRKAWEKAHGWNAGARATARWLLGAPDSDESLRRLVWALVARWWRGDRS